MSAFYDIFERHDHASGLKAQSTHYCAGCGHGLAHKYLARAIEELAIQDRTIAISPVGCSVFLYYYFDVGNTQAAHGRAPAVALGHKLANPDSVVVSYQGDGDLASIGLTEIMHVAQLGVPLTIIFVNNAIYGMTGGQLAPTTLFGQRTTTSPDGRDHWMGQPLKMAELVAQLDGSVYVERVALYDAKQRVRAQKAIKKALRIQAENKGFAFVEVLAECPTHLRMTPQEAETWVRERMLPIYPLGVKKDAVPETWGAWRTPSFDGDALLDVIGAVAEPPPRFCAGWSAGGSDGEVGLKLAGAGGDGAQTAAYLIARAAMNEGLDATQIPSYGPESRGGTSYADVRVARTEVLSPDVVTPDILVAFNAPSAAKFAPHVAPGGVVLYDSSVILHRPEAPPGVRVVGVPATEIATHLGQAIVKNTVALGALQAVTELFPAETFLTAIRQMLDGKGKAATLNESAFQRGAAAVAKAG